VLTLVDLAVLELAGSVGTHEVARLATGQTVRVRVEGLEAPVEGRIDRIAPAAEPGTRAIGVTVVVPNREEKLRAGQFAVASLTLPDATPRLTVPSAAVVGPDGQAQVWAIEGGVLARRSVTLGRRSEAQGLVEIRSGLASDSLVLAARFDGLREGRQAKVADGVAAVASAAASSPLR
jgi:RND family efflux transporter MFP subunit